MISFCIPAHNEEQLLSGTLAAINNAARELSLDFEIVVADDGSTDGTAMPLCRPALESFGSSDAKLPPRETPPPRLPAATLSSSLTLTREFTPSP